MTTAELRIQGITNCRSTCRWAWLAIVMILSAGCAGQKNVGRAGLITGGFLGEKEIARVADLMARDLIREPQLFEGTRTRRVAFVNIDNQTNQYLFESARNAYVQRMRGELQRVLRGRVEFVDPEMEGKLKSKLVKWAGTEDGRVEDPQRVVESGVDDASGVDWLLCADFKSLDKIVEFRDKKNNPQNRNIVELQMTFCLVDARSAEIAWQHDVRSYASFSTRDFHN